MLLILAVHRSDLSRAALVWKARKMLSLILISSCFLRSTAFVAMMVKLRYILAMVSEMGSIIVDIPFTFFLNVPTRTIGDLLHNPDILRSSLRILSSNLLGLIQQLHTSGFRGLDKLLGDFIQVGNTSSLKRVYRG